MDIDIEDKKVRVGLAAIIILVAGCFINRDQKLECVAPTKYCILHTTNLYGINRTQKLFPAQNIDHLSVDSYTARRGSKGNRKTVTRYSLSLVSKTGQKKQVFDNFGSYDMAYKKGGKIIDCVKNEKYPCKFERY